MFGVYRVQGSKRMVVHWILKYIWEDVLALLHFYCSMCLCLEWLRNVVRMVISFTADFRTKPCTNAGQKVYQLRKFVLFFGCMSCERSCIAPRSEPFPTWRLFLQVSDTVLSCAKHSGRGLLYCIKSKCVTLNTIKACGGARVHLHLRTRWRRVVSFTPRPLYSLIQIEPEGKWVPETGWTFGISAPAGNWTKTSLSYRP